MNAIPNGSRASGRCAAVWIVALLCVAPTGCARLRSFRGQNADPAPDSRTFPVRNASAAPRRLPELLGQKAQQTPLASVEPERRPAAPLAAAGAPAVASADPVGSIPALEEPPPLRAVPAATSAGSRASTIQTKVAAADPVDKIRSLVTNSQQRLAGLTSYQVHLTRQERVGETLQPQEDVILSIKRTPRAVRLEWPDGPHKGREVLYSASANGGLMHIHSAGGLVPVPRMSLPPDSPLVMRTSRHPITEAGFDSIVERLKESIDKPAGAGADKLSYERRDDSSAGGRPCDRITRVTPTGETWVVDLDAESHLPVRVEATSASGELLERYEFRDLRTDVPELAAADAFDPDARWGPPKGLLGRLARSNGSASPDSPAAQPP